MGLSERYDAILSRNYTETVTTKSKTTNLLLFLYSSQPPAPSSTSQIFCGPLHPQSVNSSVYSGLLEGMERFFESDPAVHTDDLEQMVDKVLTEDFVLIAKSNSVRGLLAGRCGLTVVDAGMRQTMSSVVLPAGSALTKALSSL